MRKRAFILCAFSIAACMQLSGCGVRPNDMTGENGDQISASELIEEISSEQARALERVKEEPDSPGAELKEADSESAEIVEYKIG